MRSDKLRYRPDIDGLRALAILPILLFHAGVQQLRGGFTGVDIFFVISGYLITSILQREMREGSFSFAKFYARRVARILPALFAVLIVTLISGIFLLLPRELANLGWSISATAGFSANIYSFFTTDYFGSAADSKILLHMWSLGVEEQFYIFFPFLLLTMRCQSTKRQALTLASIAAVSFALNFAQAFTAPTAAFYLLPGRVWELAAGSLIALGFYPKVEDDRVRTGIAIVGVFAIGSGIVFLKPQSMFPAPTALLPVGGAALLIAYGARTLPGKILSTRPLRWLGLISYSLYLWHWPLITFYRLRYGMTLDAKDTAILLIVSVLAATASYFLVEQPFSRAARRQSARRINLGGVFSIVSMIVIGCAVATNAATIRPVPSEVSRIESYISYPETSEEIFQFRPSECFGKPGETQYDYARCLQLDDGKENVVVLGDSHAAQYWRAIAERFPEYNVIQATASGCRPLLQARGRVQCTALMAKVLREMVPSGRIDAVVLAARWLPQEDEALQRTITYLRKYPVRVMLIGPTVEYDGDFPNLLGRAILRGDVRSMSKSRLQSRKLYDQHMAAAYGNQVTYFSEQIAECPNDKCTLLAPDGSPFHFDYGHLTLSASRAIILDLPRP